MLFGLKTMCPYLYPYNSPRHDSLFRNKAASDGALSFYHDHLVDTRVSKIAHGAFCGIRFNPSDPDHQQRLHKTYTSATGERRIDGRFSVILPKVCFLIAQC